MITAAYMPKVFIDGEVPETISGMVAVLER